MSMSGQNYVIAKNPWFSVKIFGWKITIGLADLCPGPEISSLRSCLQDINRHGKIISNQIPIKKQLWKALLKTSPSSLSWIFESSLYPSWASLFSSLAFLHGEQTSGIETKTLRTGTGNLIITDGEDVEDDVLRGLVMNTYEHLWTPIPKPNLDLKGYVPVLCHYI